MDRCLLVRSASLDRGGGSFSGSPFLEGMNGWNNGNKLWVMKVEFKNKVHINHYTPYNMQVSRCENT